MVELAGLVPHPWPCVDDLSLFYCLATQWLTQERTFFMIEQDIVPSPTALQEMRDCPEPWCALASPLKSPIGAVVVPTFGCTKFEKSFIARTRSLWSRIADAKDFRCEGDPRHWRGLDGRIGLTVGALLNAPVSSIHTAWPHRHEGWVFHGNVLYHSCKTTLVDEIVKST